MPVGLITAYLHLHVFWLLYPGVYAYQQSWVDYLQIVIRYWKF